MLKRLCKWLGKPEPEPEPEPIVGNILVCNIWGIGWQDIEIVRVSEDKTQIQYKFLSIEGRPIHYRSYESIHDTTWSWAVSKYIVMTHKEYEDAKDQLTGN